MKKVHNKKRYMYKKDRIASRSHLNERRLATDTNEIWLNTTCDRFTTWKVKDTELCSTNDQNNWGSKSDSRRRNTSPWFHAPSGILNWDSFKLSRRVWKKYDFSGWFFLLLNGRFVYFCSSGPKWVSIGSIIKWLIGSETLK